MIFEKIKFVLVIIFILLIQNVYGQRFFIKSYTVENGLPTRIVLDACQDAEGYMWFATYFGISKYDGFTFTNYNKENGLPDQHYKIIKYDEKGVIWASPYYSNDTIAYYKNNIWNKISPIKNIEKKFEITAFDVLYNNNKPILCLGSYNGFYIYQDNIWTHYDVSEDISKNFINKIIAKNNKFVIASRNGICIFENGKLDFSLNNKIKSHSSNVIAIDIENQNTQDEKLWILGLDWLGCINNNNFELYSQSFLLPDVTTNNNSYLKLDNRGNIFFGNSVAKYFINRTNREMIPMMISNGFSSNGASSIFIDKESNIWLSDSRGVDKVSNFYLVNYFKDNGMFENEVSAIAEMDDGRIVLGHNTGITIFKNNIFKYIPFKNNSKFNSIRVLDISKDNIGNIWFAASDLGVGKLTKNEKNTMVSDRT